MPKKFPIPVPKGQSLAPFQEQLIQDMMNFYQLKSMKAVYNGSDQGTGKTIVAICLINAYKALRKKKRCKTLIICPASVRGNWEEEIRLFSTDAPITVRTLYSARDAIKPIHENTSYVITSYQLLLKRNVFNTLYAVRWDHLIIDEMQNIVNPTAKRVKLIFLLWNRIRKAQFLSGTPVRGHAHELFPALHLAMPERFPNFEEFASEFSLKKYTPWGKGYEYHGVNPQTAQELADTMKNNFFVRKLKEVVLPELPERTYQIIELDCGKLEDPMPEEYLEQVRNAIRNDEPIPKKPQIHISQRMQYVSAAKLEQSTEFIESILDSGEALILFCYHRLIIEGAMEKYSAYNPEKLYGATPPKERQQLINRFNNGDFPLFVVQIQAGGVGLNLQKACNTVAFLETSYSPSEINQAIDRVHRMGQTKHVNAYFLTALKSYDNDIMKILLKKQKTFDKIIPST